MTLQEILDILDANIKANNGTLKLAPDTIQSPEISKIFEDYLLDEDLVVENAQTKLDPGKDVTVTGDGASLIFFKTAVDTLAFTVTDSVPAMSVKAAVVIQEKEGWTFGASFPVLKLTNWGGFANPADPTQWVQYIFFDNGSFTLSKEGLHFRGFLRLIQGLEPLSILFGDLTKVEVKGPITLNKGEDGFVADANTVVPEMDFKADIGNVTVPIGDFSFKLTFAMKSSAFIVPEGDLKGKPVPVLEMLLQSTVPIDDEEIGIGMSLGTQAGSITLRALLPENTEVGVSELISLANNANILSAFPSNIPIIDEFILKDWRITFNASQKTLNAVTIEVATRETFTWTLIPGAVTLTFLDFWLNVGYTNGKFDPAFTIEGTIGLGKDPDPVLITISGSYPGYVFMGSLDPETPIDLRGILIHFLGEALGSSLPDTLQIGVLDIAVDTKNSTYSLATGLTTNLEIPVVLTTIVVKTILFNIDYVAGTATGSMTGRFKVGTEEKSPEAVVTAAYNGPEDGWTFSGGLEDGSEIKLKELIDTYLPEEYRQFNPFDITITKLWVSFTQGTVKKYDFKLGANWKLDLGLKDPFIIEGLTEIAYDPLKEIGKQYTGFIEGALNFGNIRVGARVDFKDQFNDYTFFFNGFQAKLTHNTEGDSIICFNFTDETTLGDVIELLVGAAIGQDVTLPSPWNVVNNIKLRDFGFSFNITKNKIGLSYRPSINLGFINIKEITLFYTYSPDGSESPVVEFAITDGSFLGGAQPLPEPWNVLDPADAPPVPGEGENLFRLDFLGLGQHVSLKDGLSPDSVSQAVDFLRAAFEKKTALAALPGAGTSPIEGTGLKFNSASNWLIGTEFVIVDTFSMGIVFFDPDVYGLSLYVNGPKAKVFQGLKFEILYKKVSDTVGVYQIYLKLPDAIRQLDFGSVSVTLPSVRLYIYTNGDFKVDFGFPANENFSESFGLQWLPFIGSGGFYFGVLSAETAETVPDTTKGNFSPVIVFGVGLRVGIGKEINKGIFKAGLSVTVQGILEGTYAQFNPYNGTGKEDDIYFYTLGKLALVGHLYGAVNFAIISAEVDIRVFISARIVLETHEPVLITLSAGVSVRLKVKINLGIFKISITLSFSITIKESFKIGSRSAKPWGDNSLSIPFRLPALRALDTANACPVIPVMNWQPLLPPARVELAMLYVPQFTAATGTGETEQKARAAAMLYLENSVDQPTTKKRVERINHRGETVVEEEDYPFAKFAKGAFLWVLGAYINKEDQGIPLETVLQSEIGPEKLEEILCYFSQGLPEPFTYDNILAFMENYLDVTVTIPPRDAVDSSQVSVFPILPLLAFKTPTETIYFDNDKAKYTYDNAQLDLIRKYFEQLAVRYLSDTTPQEPAAVEPGEKQSLATFMLIDYLALLAKEAVQNGIDRLNSLALTVEDGLSPKDIVRAHPNFGISAEELAFSNRTRPLSAGTELHIKEMKYTVKSGDSLEKLAHRFGLSEEGILDANTFSAVRDTNPCAPTGPQWENLPRVRSVDENKELIPGETIVLPGFKHTTSHNRPESLLSIANRYGIPALSLIRENLDVPNLFPPGKKIVVPFVEKMTVADLVAAMEENHDFEQLSGLSANIFLQGLRVPLPGGESEIGKPEALYRVTGQEIDGSTLTVGEQLSLTLESASDWFHLGTPGGTELPFDLLQEDIDALQGLQNTALTPHLLELKASDLFDLQDRKFTLPSNISWQLPESISLANGNNRLQADVDPSIWTFKNSLQALLSGTHPVTPRVRLLKQVQETLTAAGEPVPVENYSWSTKVDVTIRRMRSSENPGQFMPNVYEVQAIDQGSMALLRNLIEYYADNAGTDIIDLVDILFTKEPAKEGQEEPPSGLRSDRIDNTTVFLLQNNLSTLSNPPLLFAGASFEELDTQPNLLGMTAIEFLKFLWEAAVVGTGGYLLYYLVNDSKAGLPDYLFSGDADGQVTLVITYKITDDVLQDFLNSVVIRDPIDISSEILYVETTGIKTKVATVPPGNIGFTMTRQNPDNRTDVTKIEKDLEELYNLLGYNIAANDDFIESDPGLPVAPADNEYRAPRDPGAAVRPTSESDADWKYNRIVPVFPFAKPVEPGGGSGTETDIPPEKDNPYRAVGKSAQIDMRWHDIFGNLTGFTDTAEPGVPTVLPPVKTGYIDPVIGLGQFPSVSGSYIIDKDTGGNPVLIVTLAFNPTIYQPVDENDEGWRERARVDRDTYRQIYYQLIREDMTVTVANTLEAAAQGSVKEGSDIKAVLLALVLEIYNYLGEILVPGQRKAGSGETVPGDKTVTLPIGDTNPRSLFEVVTTLTLSRDIELVDESFKDEPSVHFSTAVLGPNLKKEESQRVDGLDNSITIEEFAQKLEAAFPQLKAASGLPQTGIEEDSPVDIWAVRFGTPPSGIDFTVLNAGNPFYFALQPLSTHLLSRENVKIYPYITGRPIYENPPADAAFNGVDLERLAEDFLNAVDLFLQADFSIPAYLIDNSKTSPYQSVLDSKKILAENIVKHLAVVLEDGNTPDAGNTEAAAERLKQQLLINLSDAYSIDTVLQFDVNVDSQYTDPAEIAPNLFGKVLDPTDTTPPEQKAYAFSTTRFSLEKSNTNDPVNPKRSYLTILFNTKKENDEGPDSAFFPISLQYEINSVEHDIREVKSIEGYKSSSWLTFILPFGNQKTDLGDLKIPVPLRAYPTAPSLTEQTFIPEVKQFKGSASLEDGDEDKLQKAKAWSYRYTYDYIRAQQDTVDTDILLNVDLLSPDPALFRDEDDPDLFAALLQFTSAYPDIQGDFNRFLLDGSNPEDALTAMQSFAWLVNRAARAWGTWQEKQKLYADAASGEQNYKYRIVEGETIIDEQTALLITVTPREGTTFQLPDIGILGYIPEIIENEPAAKSFAYYTEEGETRKYLSPGDGRKIPQRSITFGGLNILEEEDAWAGLSIIRNQILVPGVPTNDDFIYRTPAIRFVNVLTPLLDPAIEIDIADFTPGDEKQPLQLYLSNFLQAFFKEIAAGTAARRVKIGTNYTYNIQENRAGLQTDIPISISTPFEFDIPTDWETDGCPGSPGEITPGSPFVCQLTALIQSWFKTNEPERTNGRLVFDISLFSSLSDTQLPVLRIRKLYLDIEKVSNV